MSHIATALAKSKGKTVSAPAAAGAPAAPGGLSSIRIGPQSTPVLTRPPFAAASAAPFPATAAGAPAPEMPVSKPMAAAAPKRSTLVVVACAIVLVAGASAWLLLQKDNRFAQLTQRPKPATPQASAPAPAKAAPIEIAPERKAPSPELAEKVRTLPITAAAGGTSQRLSMGGKIYEPGQPVAEGLILQAIETEEIVFRDTDGNIYTRKL